MNRIFVILLVSMALSACDENEDFVNADVYFDMSIKDQAGRDLLNPMNSGSLSEGDIKLYHLIDNERVYYFKGNLDAPKGFKILNATDPEIYYLRVFPDGQIKNNESILYLEFNELDLDVIKTYYNVTGANVVCTKVLYNDNVVWDAATATGLRYFEVVKK